MLLAPTNVTSDDARRHQFGVAVFHEPRINPQAHGIPAIAFYPGVYRGVIYISAGKAVSEKIYRLVGELNLDWIFSCINRGKIIIW